MSSDPTDSNRLNYSALKWPSSVTALSLSLLILLLSGCSNHRKLRATTGESAGRIPAGLETTIAEIATVPLVFTMQIPAATYGWERARIFFESHTSASSFVAGRRAPGQSDTTAISNERSLTDAVIFSVERSDTTDGQRFAVACQRGSSSVQMQQRFPLDLQCRNLARFIRDGTLEGELLTR